MQAAEKTVEASKTQVAAHNQVAEAASRAAQASTNAANQTAESSNKASDAIKNQAVQVHRVAEETVTAMRMYGASGKLVISRWLSSLNQSVRLYRDVNSAIKNVNDSMEDGENLAVNLARAEKLAAANAHWLGEQTLKKLRKAIEDAREKMAQFAEEAARAKREAEKELLGAQGRNDEIEKMEHDEKINELRKRHESAKKLGANAKSVADDYQKAIEVSNRAFEERKRREAAERERERIAAQQRERERAEQQRQRELERQQRANSKQNLNVIANQPIDVNIDEAELYALINEIKSSSANTAVQTLFKQLQNAAAQSR